MLRSKNSCLVRLAKPSFKINRTSLAGNGSCQTRPTIYLHFSWQRVSLEKEGWQDRQSLGK
jgi:hypothetical protein